MKISNQTFTVLLMLTISILFACKKDKGPENTVRDIEGNVYKTVKIGTQTWMMENLKVTKLNDGTPIDNLITNEEWGNSTGAAYCWYDNDKNAHEKYGALYNLAAVYTDKLAPKGWHVATDADWVYVRDYLINNGYNYDEGNVTDNHVAKALASTSGWVSNLTPGNVGYNQALNNKSGFNALPAGVRFFDGYFTGLGEYATFWSSLPKGAQGGNWGLDFFHSLLYYNSNNKLSGYSVRCVKD